MSALFVEAALSYAARGLPVFPCWPRDKTPFIAAWEKRATTDANTITGWWRGNPDCNIGLATGERSGLFVVDLDGEEAETELSKLEQRYSPLPATVESKTARGRHLFFACPSHGRIRNSAGKIAPKIDVRGEGGFVVLPPSIHPSGKPYAWNVNNGHAFATPPVWLLAQLATAKRRAALAAAPATDWGELIRDGVDEGQRNDTIARLAGHLLRSFVGPAEVLEFLLIWNEVRCRPPLDPDEVRRTVDSICALEMRRRGGR